ncbi:DUF1345 domain-containing protein [Humibacter ginsenosidimutans]|uniref:DUF1345 domain-containing protein n=2 Tax=Humibacter ginsenosidimutans TaxID=2599293 RepID=A0A5B8M8W2_9MICO|nr:DUF1345 domain-containing protein [Humibacter ginsenosidimutans]
MLVVGIIAGTTIGLTGSWWYAAVGGWAAACAVYIAWVWIVIGRFDGETTKLHATREDPGRAMSELLIVLIAIASLLAVAVLLVHTSRTHGVAQAAGAGAAVLSVALSWTLLHTLYTLRYARIYYSDPIGGIDFNDDEDPRYVDFAYLSFDLGMTYQVSDTNIRTSQLRSVILRHTLLSYVFGTVVLASTINLVAGLAF